MTRHKPLLWLLLPVVLVGALAVGAQDGSGDTQASRVRRLASQIRCPTCQGLSAADSDAPAARAIVDEVTRQVAEGRSDAQIRGFVVERYGRDILQEPDASGVGWLVWGLPVVAVVLAVAGLAVAFRRWRPRHSGQATDADRAIVEAALSEGA